MGMRRMGTRCLVLPPNFAYGAQGAPPQIAPGATLLVELTVLKVRGAADADQVCFVIFCV
jgi:FKBP-type peptidyl-prolyl cis-trans isomerase